MIDKQQFLKKTQTPKKFFTFCIEKQFNFEIRKLCKPTIFSVERFGK